MADDITITEGTGTTIATDDVGGDHYQRIKLTDGTADSTTTVNVDIGGKANALRVAPASDITDGTYIGDIKFGESIPAGTALIGNVKISDGTETANVNASNQLEVSLETDSVGLAQESGGNLATLAGAVSGSEMQVDVVTMPTTTVTDDGNFTLAANDGVDIGDVGISNVIATVSTNNSTTSTLGSGGVFTGTGEEIHNYASIKVSAFADQDSATDGLQLQFSSDGSNWDISYDFDVTANQAFVAEVGPEAQYFRVVYTNGGSAQGAFRLQTTYHPVVTEKLGVPIESTVDPEDNAQLVRSILVAKDPGGDYGNINRTSGGNLKTSIEEFAGSLPAGTNNIGDVDIASALPAGTNLIGNVKISDGTETANVNASNELQVRDDDANTDLDTIAGAVSGSEMQVDIVADGAGLATESTLGSVQTAVELIDDAIYTDDADWTGGSSKHLLVGGLYSTTVNEITDGDVGPMLLGKDGGVAPGRRPHAWSATVASADATSATQVKAAGGAGTRHYITSLVISTDTAMNLQIQDDAGTPNVAIEDIHLAANGGMVYPIPPGSAIEMGADNQDIDVVASAAGNISVTMTGYTI